MARRKSLYFPKDFQIPSDSSTEPVGKRRKTDLHVSKNQASMILSSDDELSRPGPVKIDRKRPNKDHPKAMIKVEEDSEQHTLLSEVGIAGNGVGEVDHTANEGFADAAKPAAVIALELAARMVDNYAGPQTKQLEKTYLEWQASCPRRDEACLACLKDNTDLQCRTCSRVYHEACLDTIQFKLTNSRTPTKDCIYCPLCTKRIWHYSRPRTATSAQERNRRMLKLGGDFLAHPKTKEWIMWDDDGTILSDQKLLFKLGVVRKQN